MALLSKEQMVVVVVVAVAVVVAVLLLLLLVVVVVVVVVNYFVLKITLNVYVYCCCMKVPNFFTCNDNSRCINYFVSNMKKMGVFHLQRESLTQTFHGR